MTSFLSADRRFLPPQVSGLPRQNWTGSGKARGRRGQLPVKIEVEVGQVLQTVPDD